METDKNPDPTITLPLWEVWLGLGREWLKGGFLVSINGFKRVGGLLTAILGLIAAGTVFVWKKARPNLGLIIGLKIATLVLGGLAYLVWQLFKDDGAVINATNTITVVLVGLLITVPLAYLVVRKLREGSFSGVRKNKPKPSREQVSASTKRPVPEPKVVSGRTVVKRGWFWPAIAMTTLFWLVFGDNLKDKWQRDMGGSAYTGSSRNVAYQEKSAALPLEATLAIIAECESRNKHRDEHGVITNKNDDGSTDIGRWQINSQHEARAKGMEIDIWTEEGNEAFAKVLFDESGTDPWNSSRKCWGDKIHAPYAETFSGVTIATRMFEVGREWSDWVPVPTGQDLYFERLENIAFEAEAKNGKTFRFPRNFPGHHRFPDGRDIRFRVIDEGAEKLSIWLRYSPYKVT